MLMLTGNVIYLEKLQEFVCIYQSVKTSVQANLGGLFRASF